MKKSYLAKDIDSYFTYLSQGSMAIPCAIVILSNWIKTKEPKLFFQNNLGLLFYAKSYAYEYTAYLYSTEQVCEIGMHE